MSIARKGKIARCPVAVRDEVNRRLLNGEGGPKILAWLNANENVLRVLDEHFGDEPVSASNLSEWRQGGYQDFLKRNERVAQTKELSDYALALAKAGGGNISDAGAAILAGQILEVIEAGPQKVMGEDGKETTEYDMAGLAKAIVALRTSDQEARKSGQRERILDQRDRALDQRERQVTVSERQIAAKFLDAYADKHAKAIIESNLPRDQQIEQLRLRMFPQGELTYPEPINPDKEAHAGKKES